MADNEIKPLVTVVSFLALFGILFAMIPAEFYPETYEVRELNIPEHFEGIDIQSFAETWECTLNETLGGNYGGGFYYVNIGGDDNDFGGHDVDLVYKKANQSEKCIVVINYWTEWWILNYQEDMKWYNTKQIKRSEWINVFAEAIPLSNLEEDFDIETSIYSIKTSRFQFRLYLGYNTTNYSSVEDAWDHHQLHVLCGIAFDQLQTTLNAWNVISMILFFQMPDVHPILNAIIAIPLWVAIAYLVYVLILKAIPFVG